MTFSKREHRLRDLALADLDKMSLEDLRDVYYQDQYNYYKGLSDPELFEELNRLDEELLDKVNN